MCECYSVDCPGYDPLCSEHGDEARAKDERVEAEVAALQAEVERLKSQEFYLCSVAATEYAPATTLLFPSLEKAFEFVEGCMRLSMPTADVVVRYVPLLRLEREPGVWFLRPFEIRKLKVEQ